MEERSRGETKQNSDDPISDQEDSQKEGENGKVGIIEERIRISLSRWKGPHLLPNPMNEN